MEIKINTDELRKCKLFVATPMYGGQCAGMFARSIARSFCSMYTSWHPTSDVFLV